MTFYLQKINGDWASINIFNAKTNLELRGEIISFETEEDLAEITVETPVIAHISMMKYALKKLNFPYQPVDFIEPFKPFYRRKIWTGRLAEVLEPTDWPVFVKPLHDNKIFTGVVIGQNGRNLHRLGNIDPNLKVLFSEVVTFVSEWRAFILDGQILGIRQYDGRCDRFPDAKIVENITSSAKLLPNFPIAYSIDVGVNEAGETLLIEINDGYALGAYGLQAHLYANMLLSRWNQLTGQNVYEYL